MKRLFTLMLLVATVGFAYGQVSVQGTAPSKKYQLQKKVEKEIMPSFNLEARKAEDDALYMKGYSGFRFAYPHHVKITPKNAGTWEDLPDGGRVWRVRITSFGAHTMNLTFKRFHLPAGGEMYLYNEDRSYEIGAFTAANHKADGGFATAPIPGETIFVEYYEPAGMTNTADLHISSVNHDYANLLQQSGNALAKGFGDSGSCNNNVNCPEGNPWVNQINSVALIVVNGFEACTGAMINNTSADQTPYFLSANHCGTGISSSWVFVFNYQSPTCTPNQNGSFAESVTGGSFRAAWAGSDVALFELSVPPPDAYNVFYAGWDRTGTTPSGSVGIHHPSGDVKKISFDTDSPGVATFGGADTWNVQNWEDGTTEPGSSGSPLFDVTNGRIIGQLFGGSASCSSITDDFYGRFNTSWGGNNTNSTRLSNWLDPTGTGDMTLDGQYFGGNTLVYNMQANMINSPQGTTCDMNIAPEVVVRNLGSATITTFDIEYNFDGGATQTFTWTGSLDLFQSETVTLPSEMLGVGAHTFTFSIVNPNGNSDEDAGNNSLSSNFDVIDGLNFTVNLTTDDYPGETSYQVLDGNGAVVASASGFGAGATLFSDIYCLPEGCYTFVIDDSYGDGICCAWGNGGYELLDNFGTVLATGGQFSDTESIPFCLSASSLIANFTVDAVYCLGDDVDPTDLSANAASWTWDTPGADQATYSGQAPTITYSSVGTYTITLTVGDGGGNTSTTSRDIEVAAGPTIVNVAGPTISNGGDQNTYAVAPASGSTWDWEITGGTQQTGASTNIISVLWDNGITAGEVCVTETDVNGCESDEFCIMVDLMPSSIEEVFEANNLEIFPNPTSGQLNITMSNQAQSIEVFDVIGRSVLQINQPALFNQFEMPTSDGVYMVRIQFEDGIATQKVVVSRP
ncbi:MAG: T9SS type A sorting domain-containing protein [Bacteroidota bacterium]